MSLETSVAAAEFDVQTFLGKEGLSIRDLTSLKKVDLKAMADHLNLGISKHARKDALLNSIASHLNVD